MGPSTFHSSHKLTLGVEMMRGVTRHLQGGGDCVSEIRSFRLFIEKSLEVGGWDRRLVRGMVTR